MASEPATPGDAPGEARARKITANFGRCADIFLFNPDHPYNTATGYAAGVNDGLPSGGAGNRISGILFLSGCVHNVSLRREIIMRRWKNVVLNRLCFLLVFALSLTAIPMLANADDPTDKPLWYRCSHNYYDSDASETCTSPWSDANGTSNCNISAICPDDDENTTSVRTYVTVAVTVVDDLTNCNGTLTSGSC